MSSSITFLGLGHVRPPRRLLTQTLFFCGRVQPQPQQPQPPQQRRWCESCDLWRRGGLAAILAAKCGILRTPSVERYRPVVGDPSSAAEVHLFKDRPMAPLLMLKRMLRMVACLLGSICRNCLTLAGAIDLDNECKCVLESWPLDLLIWFLALLWGFVSLLSG